MAYLFLKSFFFLFKIVHTVYLIFCCCHVLYVIVLVVSNPQTWTTKHAEAYTPTSPGTQTWLNIEADMQQWNVEPARYLSTSLGKRSAAGDKDRGERRQEDNKVHKCCSESWMSCTLGSGLDGWVGEEPAKLIVEVIAWRNWEEGRSTNGHVGRRGMEMPARWITTLTWWCWLNAVN